MKMADNLFPCDDADQCYRAVTTAYREMLARREDDRIAFKSALAVFRHHHPEVQPSKASFVIAEWLG